MQSIWGARPRASIAASTGLRICSRNTLLDTASSGPSHAMAKTLIGGTSRSAINALATARLAALDVLITRKTFSGPPPARAGDAPIPAISIAARPQARDARRCSSFSRKSLTRGKFFDARVERQNVRLACGPASSLQSRKEHTWIGDSLVQTSGSRMVSRS
jgi:hypothetical protein